MKNKFLSFLDGMGSVFGLFPPKIHNPYENGKTNDSLKLQEDWNIVGKDLKKSFNKLLSEEVHGIGRKKLKAH